MWTILLLLICLMLGTNIIKNLIIIFEYISKHTDKNENKCKSKHCKCKLEE